MSFLSFFYLIYCQGF